MTPSSSTPPPQQYQGKAKSGAVRVAGTLPARSMRRRASRAADGTRIADAATIDKVLAKAGVKAVGPADRVLQHRASRLRHLVRAARGQGQQERAAL